jgi:hypothetical protein
MIDEKLKAEITAFRKEKRAKKPQSPGHFAL